MKAILICLLLGLSVSYKGDLAVSYAKSIAVNTIQLTITIEKSI